MRYDVRILAAPDSGSGFRLAGFSTAVAEDVGAAQAQVHEWMQQPHVGVILVDDRFYAQFGDALRDALARRPVPLVVPFPRPQWVAAREAAEAYVVELLRRAIGYRVKLI